MLYLSLDEKLIDFILTILTFWNSVNNDKNLIKHLIYKQIK